MHGGQVCQWVISHDWYFYLLPLLGKYYLSKYPFTYLTVFGHVCPLVSGAQSTFQIPKGCHKKKILLAQTTCDPTQEACS